MRKQTLEEISQRGPTMMDQYPFRAHVRFPHVRFPPSYPMLLLNLYLVSTFSLLRSHLSQN